MMERVLITGTSGENVYFDQRGRTLRTMGDISVNVGDWVWTNGTTIYGHQVGGPDLPPIIEDGPVIPISTVDDNGLCVKRLSPVDYELRPWITGKTLGSVPALWYYTGDDTAVYGMMRDGKWHNMTTGDIVAGSSFFGDSAVADGHLYTIYSTGNASSADKWDGKISESYAIFSYIDLIDSNGGSPGRCWNIDFDFKDFSGAPQSPSSNDAQILVTCDGAIIKTIDLGAYMENVRSIISNKLQSLHATESPGDSADDALTFPDDPSLNQGPQKGEGRSRPRPDPYIRYASATAKYLRIYEDGSWSAVIECDAAGVCYPWFTHKWAETYNSKEYTVKEWLVCNVSYSSAFVIGRNARQLPFGGMTVSIDGGILNGGAAYIGDDPPDPEVVDIVDGVTGLRWYDTLQPGYGTNGVDSDPLKTFQPLYIIGSGLARHYSIGYGDSDVIKSCIELIENEYSENGGQGYDDTTNNTTMPTSYDLNDGFSMAYSTDEDSGVSYVTVIDPDGKKVVTMDNNSYSLYVGNATLISALKIADGVYALCIPYMANAGLLLIKDGVITQLADICYNNRLHSYKYGAKLKHNVKWIDGCLDDTSSTTQKRGEDNEGDY